MRDYKIYICTALFICLTAIKLSFPESTGQIRERVRWLISQETDYAEMIQTMGRSLGNGEIDGALVQVIGYLMADEENRLSALNTEGSGDHEE